MAIKRRDLEQLIARLGAENVLVGAADRLVYSTDIGSPPGIVDLLVKRKADAVARCRTIEDVQTVVQFCRKRFIPITPRAAATNALGGAVPKRGGIVLDLTPMTKNIDIDERSMTVSVDAGVVIWDLQKRLLDVGLELPCYPTSGLAATIGGFVAMDGHGIHATRAGNIGKHVVEVEGVGADGERFHVRDADAMGFFVGLGGSTGIITRIRLKVVEASKDKPVLIAVKRTEALQAIVEEATRRFPVKHVMFRNADFFALRTEAIGERKNPLGGKHAVLLAFPESKYAGVKDDIVKLAARHDAAVLDDATADKEWEQRFYPIRFKRLGPSLVAGEVYVPVTKLAAYLKRLHSKVAARELSVEGHITDDGRVYFFITTPDDERRITYPLGWSTSAWILSTAKKFGGRSYQSGVWLQWESKSVFGKVRYSQLKAFKKQTDHRNIMNPGTVFPLPAPVPEFVYKMKVPGPVPAPSLGFQLWAGNPILQSQGAMVRYRRHKSLGVKAADVAADLARGQDLGLYSDLIWGCDLPSLQAVPNPGNLPMTQTPRGKMVLAKLFVQGKIADPWALKPALDVADPAEAPVAPEYAEILKVLDAFRRTVQNEGVELEVKAVEVPKEEVKAADDHPVVTERKTEMSVEEIKKLAAATDEKAKAWVLAADCIVCNGCEAACPTDAAIVTDMARVDRDLCIADGACFDACPTGAIRPGIEDEAASGGWPKGSRLAGKFGVPIP
jgi:FAD/FMN-containing dehydrogenase/ferredoxin